jgi:VWFA-related protein
VENAIAALRVEGENTALYDALAAAAHHLEKREEGRVAVLFTDGTETVHSQDEAEERLSSAIAGAAKKDVTVYTVAFGPRAAAWVLERIAAETGGEAFKAASEKELTNAFGSIAESVGSRYLLGYRQPSGGSAGFRRIEVKVSRPDVKVVARRGYYSR